MNEKRKKLEKEYACDDKEMLSEDAPKMQRAYAFASDGLAYRSHAYCVFNDPEFQTDIIELRHLIESQYYPNISLQTSYFDRHILQDDRIPIKAVADKYHITLLDLGFYADGYFHLGYHGFGKDLYLEGGFKFIQPLEIERSPVYVIGKYTSLDDIHKEWLYAKEMTALIQFRETEARPRKRSPDNPTLIYAIFKQRLSKMTFQKIYRLYERCELPLYNGGNVQFSSDESLERYYRKYAPKPIDNDIDTTRLLTYIREMTELIT